MSVRLDRVRGASRGIAFVGALCLLGGGEALAQKSEGIGLELQPGRGGHVPAWRVDLSGGPGFGSAVLALELPCIARVIALQMALDDEGVATLKLS
jgi:hypothetical protein